jgi:hypothetical protein
MKQISAVNWLVEQMLVNNYINKKQYENCKSWLIDEAKELEKEQTDNFADDFAVKFTEWFADNTLRVDLDGYKTFGDTDETIIRQQT